MLLLIGALGGFQNVGGAVERHWAQGVGWTAAQVRVHAVCSRSPDARSLTRPQPVYNAATSLQYKQMCK